MKSVVAFQSASFSLFLLILASENFFLAYSDGKLNLIDLKGPCMEESQVNFDAFRRTYSFNTPHGL